MVHEYGSLGCSGDLAPLAHCALALMGEGPVRDASGALVPAAEALAAAKVEELSVPTLEPGETLAALREAEHDLDTLRERSIAMEALDQLAMEHLLGAR